MKIAREDRLDEFASRHPDAAVDVETWRDAVRSADWTTYSDIGANLVSVNLRRLDFLFRPGKECFVVAIVSLKEKAVYIRNVETARRRQIIRTFMQLTWDGPFYKRFTTYTCLYVVLMLASGAAHLAQGWPILLSLAVFMGFITALYLSITRWETGLVPMVIEWIGGLLARLGRPGPRRR